jgi:hypothetical protein
MSRGSYKGKKGQPSGALFNAFSGVLKPRRFYGDYLRRHETDTPLDRVLSAAHRAGIRRNRPVTLADKPFNYREDT